MKKCGHLGFIKSIFKPIIIPISALLIIPTAMAYFFNKYNFDRTGSTSNIVGGAFLGILIVISIWACGIIYLNSYHCYKSRCEHENEEK
jgi:hypothetical protein